MDYFLTIAASDNSTGAGLQQDIKVAHDLGYWPLCAVTGITVQNFDNVFAVDPVKPRILEAQIKKCLEFPVKTIKTGAICSEENLSIITDCLKQFPGKFLVIDPVLFSSSGTPFLNAESIKTLKRSLFPLADLITPNKPEFEQLTGTKINSIHEGIKIAKEKCNQWNTAILLKGGHFKEPRITEALITQHEVYHFEKPRKDLSYTHGTGCTISAALACYAGKNIPLNEAYSLASQYLTELYAKFNNP
ncbi:MAG: hydroxymethylpyrimidine/phosphomethylpyrimidine kinase [Bacteroidales bacterium]